jgi:hypothetical protein
MMKSSVKVLLLLALLIVPAWGGVSAQPQLAATLEVLAPTVTVQRVDTANPIEISVEAIVGVGDTITTGDEGRARITFFADGTTTELEPNTEYVINEFNGNDDGFEIRVSVLVGQTIQQLGRVLDANSSYEIETPGMTLAARGTTFDVRVENTGRAGMLVREGDVSASAMNESAQVPPEFGVRSEPDAPLSDVVRAATFAELDSALDGCRVSVTTPDDVSINVRTGPSLDADRVGFIAAEEIDTVVGTVDGAAWYRIPFGGAHGWFLSSTADITGDCAGLRVFPVDYREDPAAYDDSITLNTSSGNSEATQEATQDATQDATAEATAEAESD